MGAKSKKDSASKIKASTVMVVIVVILGIVFISNQQQTIEQQKREISEQKTEKEFAQEEAEKKQEEIETESERQRILNEDNDGDGLTLREEQKLGTSDDRYDTDNDGIVDSLDTNPMGGSRNIPKKYIWEYPLGGGVTFKSEWIMPINSDWYDYYKNLPRTESQKDYVTFNDERIRELAVELEETAIEKGFSVSEFIVSFVQNLPYVGDEYTGYDEYSKYPIEMLIDENGDCEDASFLAASLIKAAGYGVILVNPPGHMLIGVLCSNCQGSYYEYDGKKYYALETTNPGWKLGEMPKEYEGKKALIFDV